MRAERWRENRAKGVTGRGCRVYQKPVRWITGLERVTPDSTPFSEELINELTSL